MLCSVLMTAALLSTPEKALVKYVDAHNDAADFMWNHDDDGRHARDHSG